MVVVVVVVVSEGCQMKNILVLVAVVDGLRMHSGRDSDDDLSNSG